jgi:hypothetical protein
MRGIDVEVIPTTLAKHLEHISIHCHRYEGYNMWDVDESEETYYNVEAINDASRAINLADLFRCAENLKILDLTNISLAHAHAHAGPMMGSNAPPFPLNLTHLNLRGTILGSLTAANKKFMTKLLIDPRQFKFLETLNLAFVEWLDGDEFMRGLRGDGDGKEKEVMPNLQQLILAERTNNNWATGTLTDVQLMLIEVTRESMMRGKGMDFHIKYISA